MKKAVVIVVAVMSACAFADLPDGWSEMFYHGLEAVGSVSWVPNAFKDRDGALRLSWESGAMKFGVAKEVSSDLGGPVDWTVEAWVKSGGSYGYAGAAMEFFDAQGHSLGVVTCSRPAVSKEWRKMSWTFSAPRTAKKQHVHLLSLNREPVMFSRIKVSAVRGIDKGEIDFDVMALPAEWNKDWNGGESRMLSFTDAPLPVSFFVKGPKYGCRDLRVAIDIPAELEVRDAYCPYDRAYERLLPSSESFVTNGIAYARYIFAGLKLFEKLDAGRYKFDECRCISLVLAPKCVAKSDQTSYDICYRALCGEKKGAERKFTMNFCQMPKGLKRAKDFPVFSWNNGDRYFTSDDVAKASLPAYEAAGLVSFRKTPTRLSISRYGEMIDLLSARPVKYVFAGRFADLWRLGPCGLNEKSAAKLGVRMAVSSAPAFAREVIGKMCPEYFVGDPRIREHVRTYVWNMLSKSGVRDGDWVTFDMEPWHSSAWCHCEECHKAFAAYAKLDHVPSVKEIDSGGLKDLWANFRCQHNEKSVELLTRAIREYNPTLKCVDYDYVMPYGNDEGMKARRQACGKDTLVNEKWLDGHLCSYYHKIDLASFNAIRNDTRYLKKFYLPMAALCGYGSYLRQGEVLSPRQFRQFALAAFVHGCRGYAIYGGNCYDGEILRAMMQAQDEIARWEDLPWGKNEGTSVANSQSSQFAFASAIKTDGTEVLALFNYDSEDSISVTVGEKSFSVAPYDVCFIEIR